MAGRLKLYGGYLDIRLVVMVATGTPLDVRGKDRDLANILNECYFVGSTLHAEEDFFWPS